jgi:hypothetical protein
MLGNYMMRGLPAAPKGPLNYPAKASAGLSMILGNDRLGNCTAAGAGHIEDVIRANADSGLPSVTEAQTIAFYSATTGYNPSDPSTDQGGNEQDVLNYWRDKGFFADGSGKIKGWLRVNGADPEEIRTALWLFENLYFGVELPDGWINPMPSGNNFTWDVAGDPDPENGHCFVGVDYADAGVEIDTWGMLGTLTYPAIAKYAAGGGGELYAVLSPDAVNKASGRAPNGFDVSQLLADFQALGG